MSAVVVGAVDRFENGKGYQIDANGIKIALFRVDDEFYAISDRCPHKHAHLHRAGTPRITDEADSPDMVPRGKVECDGDDCYVLCPRHSIKFDLKTGHSPMMGVDLPTFDVHVKSGEVHIEI